ncbi:hypothetical protein Cgig2_003808 [Carnegiea gigantea]|uniref:Uncharacterized protein n=1 Tax=Carnegiea gigantea TaxID=171969 RepID=A0A9Q1K5E9_9CARY|nr:hypothetical protein Cgig2_003808 [Carnegiea gigantea]
MFGKDDSHNAMVSLLPYAIGLSNSFNEIYPNCDEEFKPHPALREDFLKEIPKSLLLNRWTKTATWQPIFDDREPNKDDLKMVIEMCNDMKKKMAVSSAKISHGILKQANDKFHPQNPSDSIINSHHRDDIAASNKGFEIVDEFLVVVWGHHLQG